MLALATHYVTAVAMGAFMLCTETCLHFGTVAQGPWVEMPWHDWIAAAWLVVAGLRRRLLELATAWAFMASLLVGSLFGHIADWWTSAPFDAGDWVSERVFLVILVGLT